ncbi:MAG: CBS and ACT domain-containing protein [Trueperaceae bacterium]|nr:CBS and ACT domain-containing protein [Trueperaceae bacterium]
MLVKDIMTERVIAIDPTMPIGDVYALMEQRNIRHFPIVRNDDLIGIVSDRDIRSVGSELPSSKQGVTLQDPVERIMSAPPITTYAADPVEESAHILRERKIGAMPVVDEQDRLIGIVTGIDFLEALIKMTGVEGATSRLEVEVDNRPGSLAALSEAISRRGVNIASVLSTRKDTDTLSFVLRVGTIDGRGLANELREEGFDVVWPTETKLV